MSDIRELAEILGIETEYYNETNEKSHYVSDEAIRLFVSKFGYDVNDKDAIEAAVHELKKSRWIKGVDNVISFFASDEKMIKFRIPEKSTNGIYDFYYTVTFEDNSAIKENVNISSLRLLSRKEIEGVFYCEYEFMLSQKITDSGYYHIDIEISNDKYSCLIVIAEDKIFMNDDLFCSGRKDYGIMVPIHALKSERNLGIGDFTDLKSFAKILADNGGKILMTMPLNMPFYKGAQEFSPYKLIDRSCFNFFYVDIEAIPEYLLEEIQNKVGNDTFVQKLNELRQANVIDYKEVLQLKIEILTEMYESFVKNELDAEKGITKRGVEFYDFICSHGDDFKNLCLFEYLIERFSKANWKNWPEEFKNCKSTAVFEFENENKNFWQFFAYVHMHAEKQLDDVRKYCNELGLLLISDIPCGSFINNAETWINKDYYMDDIEIGVRPTLAMRKGESLKIAPVNPIGEIKNDYSHLIKILRSNMKHLDGISINRISYLFRSFWIYDSNEDRLSGAYVKHNLKDIMAILSVESHKNKCMIFGKDNKNGDFLIRHGILPVESYFNNKGKDGDFIDFKKYGYNSIMLTSFYDMPTLQAFWLGEDIKLYEKLKIYNNFIHIRKSAEYRSFERKFLLERMVKTRNFLDENTFTNMKKAIGGEKIPPLFNLEVINFLSRIPCGIFIARLEDVMSQSEITKLKATNTEYDNWQNRIRIKIEDMPENQEFIRILKVLEQRGNNDI